MAVTCNNGLVKRVALKRYALLRVNSMIALLQNNKENISEQLFLMNFVAPVNSNS